MNLFTKNFKIILASNSKTRKKILKHYKVKFKVEKHNIDERKYIYNDEPVKTVNILAKKKAISIRKKFPNCIIIGSDQILVHNKKILTKPSSKKKAFQNFLTLRGEKYELLSAIYVLKEGKFFWKTIKSAKLYMEKIKKKQIKDYINEHEETVLSILGSYRVEKDVMNCISILKGNMETIQGFPIENFIKKIRSNT